MIKKTNQLEVKKEPISEKEVDELQEELKEYENMTPPHNFSYFGIPLKDLRIEEKLKNKLKERCKDWVLNPLLGLVHWSVVKYALDKGYISKKEDNWFIRGLKSTTYLSNSIPSYPWVDINAFGEFEEKLNRLKARERKNEFVLQKRIEGLEGNFSSQYSANKVNEEGKKTNEEWKSLEGITDKEYGEEKVNIEDLGED